MRADIVFVGQPGGCVKAVATFRSRYIDVKIEGVGTSRLDAMNRLWNQFDECFGAVGNAISVQLEKEVKP